MSTKITLKNACAWRLGRQHLSRRVPKGSLSAAISDVCGLQAQVLSAAELAVRARVEGVDQQDVRDALWKNHSILKTWCMRGTLHLLATADLPLYVAALKPKLKETEAWLYKAEGVSPEEVASISEAIDGALSKKPRTREELSKEVDSRTRLKRRTRRALMSAWGVLLRPAAYQGHLAFGENLGSKVTFVNPARWSSRWKEPTVNEALQELFRRYLGAYGPAAVRDFGHWWGNLSGEERSVLGSIPDELEQVEVGGTKGFMLKRDAEEASVLEPVRCACLLPSFDPYGMMFSPREAFVSASNRSRIFSKEAGWVFPTVVVDGVAAGKWTLRKRAKRVEVDVEPFRPLSSGEKGAIEAEASDVGRFFGTTAAVAYKTT